jgi:hypothetical protein
MQNPHIGYFHKFFKKRGLTQQYIYLCCIGTNEWREILGTTWWCPCKIERNKTDFRSGSYTNGHGCGVWHKEGLLKWTKLPKDLFFKPDFYKSLCILMPQCPVASQESGGGWGTTFGDPKPSYYHAQKLLITQHVKWIGNRWFDGIQVPSLGPYMRTLNL